MLLEIRDMHVKTAGKLVLRGVNLSIKRGEVFVLLGPNGSGKSSLAQSIAGNPAYQVTRGDILFDGKPIQNASPEKRVTSGIALAHQSPPAIKGVQL
jgi:Fe-S cluster assembly ATP-binding protein